MKSNKERRLIRSKQTRIRIANNKAIRLCVHRTNLHIYAQVIDDSRNIVITQASSLEKDFKAEINNGGNIAAAILIGRKLPKRQKNMAYRKLHLIDQDIDIMDVSKLWQKPRAKKV